MTTVEVFTKIAAHQVEGMMFHEQMANYYDFLGLDGYKRCHEYHYMCETITQRKVQRFFINRYNMLLPDSELNTKSAIPADWLKYSRQQVDTATKRKAVQNGINAWLVWERETRDLYTQLYEELEDNGQASAAEMVCNMIIAVDDEIKCAERKQLKLNAMDYNITAILQDQERLHDKYKKKTKKLHLI